MATCNFANLHVTQSNHQHLIWSNVNEKRAGCFTISVGSKCYHGKINSVVKKWNIPFAEFFVNSKHNKRDDAEEVDFTIFS